MINFSLLLFNWELCITFISGALYVAPDPKLKCVERRLSTATIRVVLTHSQRSLSCIKGTVPHILKLFKIQHYQMSYSSLSDNGRLQMFNIVNTKYDLSRHLTIKYIPSLN